ncbi:MAG: S8 family serine peptidase [Thermoleophilia bacterium]|nr:S8 family serine peptidase [Thermoleophilia bacterium]
MLGVVAVCAAAVVIATAATPALAADAAPQGSRAASRLWSPFFAQLRPVAVVDARHVVVTFTDPSLGAWEAAGAQPLTPAQRRAWVTEALKLQQQRLDALAAAGVQFTVDHRFIRVVNGVSLVVHGDGAELLRSVHGVAQVEPVRTVWPAAVDEAGAAGAAAAAGSEAPAAVQAAPDAIRVTVLDAGIDAAHAAVAGHVVGGAFDAMRADDAKQVELAAPDAHGTAVAGAVLRGAGQGAAVTVTDVRVLGSRPTRDGSEAVLGDSDDVIAGLEHAVDPNGDGDFSADGAQVVVIAATTPYAGFADAPEAHAVDGASALGVVVVAAAGNEGASGDADGTMGAYAAADTALSVGAADQRADTPAVDVKLQGGGVDDTISGAPLLSAQRDPKLPSGSTAVVAINRGDEVTDYLDGELRSRVSGAIALVDGQDGIEIAAQVRPATDAGAVAVLIAAHGTDALAGTLDVDGADIPAIGISRARAADLRAALADGTRVGVALTATTERNPAFGTIAGFSSSGPRLDGVGRPDVLAPGVGMLVAGADGSWRTVSGTSIAAAWAAGEVAALRSLHPDWDAVTVRAALINTALPLGAIGDRPPVDAQGAGIIDADAAAKSSWVAGTGRIDLGAIKPGGEARTALGLRGLTGAAAAAGAGTPTILLDDGGRASTVTPSLDGDQLVVAVPGDAPEGVVGGWLVLPDLGVRIPWTAVVRDASTATVPVRTALTSSTIKRVFGPGAFASTLTVTIGGAAQGEGLGIDAVQRLEVHLFTAAGTDLGSVGGLDAALPGVYSFGVTGRGPDNARLKPGAYELRLRYIPASDPTGVWRDGPVEPITVTGLKLRAAKP